MVWRITFLLLLSAQTLLASLPRTFLYDAENQLTNMYVSGQWRADFVYDGLRRRRIERDYSWSGSWVKTNEVRILYDGLLEIQERDTNNNPVVTYTRGLDLSGSIHGAGGSGGLLARTDGNGATYYHGDGAGNITALMDGSQNIQARYEYDAFGRLIGKWGTMADANVYRFSSKEYDPVAGIYYFGRRYYDPLLQRWLNRDPIGENGGINLFGFVDNSPLNDLDPYGLWWKWTYNWMPNWMVGALTGPPIEEQTIPAPAYANLNMLRDELGQDTYDTTSLTQAAAALRAASELNPVVGGFNSGYTTCTQKDAINGKKVSRASRIQAASQFAALFVPIANATRLTAEELQTAARLQQATGVELGESSDVGADFVDRAGLTYDALGTPDASQFWNEQQFLTSIDNHLLKANDYTAIDLTGFTPDQINTVRNYVNSLPQAQQNRIIRIGF